MNPYLRDKLLQKLETLSDERGYQVLDYVEFLESKYAERPAATPRRRTRSAASPTPSRRSCAPGKVSATTIAETMGLMNKAMGVLNGAAAAGKSVANDLMSATSRVVDAATTAAGTPRPAAASARRERHDWCEWRCARRSRRTRRRRQPVGATTPR